MNTPLFSFLFRLLRLGGCPFLQKPYDVEVMVTVKKVNARALPRGAGLLIFSKNHLVVY
jgi:hypothetical protein